MGKKKEKKKRIKNKLDLRLFIALVALVGFGVVMVLSASMYQSAYESGGNGLSLFIKQVIFVGVGFAAMYLLSFIDYSIFYKGKIKSIGIDFLILSITIVLLVMVLFVGNEVNGSKRWIQLGGLGTFQPSELAKFAGIVFLAAVFQRNPNLGKRKFPRRTTFSEKFLGDFVPFSIKCMLPMGILAFLIMIEPSMSATLAVCVGMGVMILLNGTSWKNLAPWVAFGIVFIIIFLIKEPWRLERISVAFGSGTQNYQINQSLLAIASGGFIGKGLGNGTQKFLFLPEMQNDFIFANIGEELGFIGCIVIIALYSYIIYRCIRIALRSPDRFGYLYTISVTFLIAFQVFVNIGVASGLLPVTGMTLPFISAGGSSVFFFFVMMGPILNLSRKEKAKGLLNE